MLAFVPVVPSLPSPRAEALGQRLAETIEQFRQQNPDLSGLEVRQAMRLAASRAGGGNAAAPALIALVAGVAVAGLAFALRTSPQHAGGDNWTLVMPIAVMVLALVAVVALKRR